MKGVIFMLKISDIPSAFILRNTWHDKIEKDLGVKNLPYKFIVGDMVGTEKNPSYIAKNDEKKKMDIIISETALKYLSAMEVPDCNVGMYFKDYLPNENSYLLLTAKGKVTPVRMLAKISEMEYNGKKYPFVDLVLNNLVLDESYVVFEKKCCMWKFIIYGDAIERAVNKNNGEMTLDKQASSIQTYMDDIERMYQDTFIHKTLVKYVCEKFAKYLEGEGYIEDAAELRSRAKVHDNSKILNKTEFQALTGIINDKSCLRDAKAALSSYKQDAIELHWKNNRHHPEYHEKVSDMSRIDRYEFVCDCYARSLQYGTEIMDFMKTRQKTRFHFPELMYDEIIHACKIIKSL